MFPQNKIIYKILSTLIFIIFLIGSTIIYKTVGRWPAIGVALEILSIYLLLELEIRYLHNRNKDNDKQ